VFSDRVPTPEALAAYYHSNAAYYHLELSPVTWRRYDELLSRFEPWRRENALLDFGCGAGGFVTAAEKHGWRAYGSEFSDDARSACAAKGLRVAKEPEEVLGSQRVDVVTTFEVMEHLADPATEVERLRRLLRPGGLLYVTTPNFGALSRRVLGPQWRVLAYPGHLHYWTAETLSAFLEPFGFRPVEVRTENVSPGEFIRVARTIVRPGRDNDHDPAVHGDDEVHRDHEIHQQVRRMDELVRGAERWPLARKAKQAINAGLSSLGWGDTLKGLFVLEGATGRRSD
jgi:2-polyprenyl-3-methyl-5-hydroxy-6-metoxy-1,4-benzoquinol methylase